LFYKIKKLGTRSLRLEQHNENYVKSVRQYLFIILALYHSNAKKSMDFRKNSLEETKFGKYNQKNSIVKDPFIQFLQKIGERL